MTTETKPTAGPCRVEQTEDSVLGKPWNVLLGDRVLSMAAEEDYARRKAAELNDFWRAAGGPDLLEACERLLGLLNIGIPCHSVDYGPVVADARAAIAKAKP